ncbi:MAG: hypothetical protein CVT95_05805 [Bacteroidetes bacterium HGW-Bacteroidetes-12]|nr:MAG: hypothetical protein CVT95_05805 [Bacteroidetes bacterium HGW-Bacteroidetes-12]
MNKTITLIVVLLSFQLLTLNGVAQKAIPTGDIKLNLDTTGNHYVKFTFLGQVWARYTDTNPGSTVFNDPVSDVYDIGLRRWRLSLYGQLTDKVFFFTQFGQNNYSNLSKRFTGSFFHDAVVEYHFHKRYLQWGMGLSGVNGLSRYATPSVGTIMSLDAPLYQQTTNGINDQFLRKLSIYAKGKISKLDYRIAITDPMAVQNANATVNSISAVSEFSTKPPKPQFQGYFMWQFLDEESNLTPYTVGSYLGKKKVFNIGAGFIFQQDAMWHTNLANDTLKENMNLLAVDLFYDSPLSEKGDAITIYASYHNLDFGKNYTRNIGVMNPATGTNANGTFNGAGNAFPMLGTGDVYYLQVGYKLKDNLLPNNGTLQPYAAAQLADFDRLKDKMLMLEGGVNYYLHGKHNAKLTLNYQSRPIFKTELNGDITTNERKGMLQLQYQISI